MASPIDNFAAISSLFDIKDVSVLWWHVRDVLCCCRARDFGHLSDWQTSRYHSYALSFCAVLTLSPDDLSI